MIIHQYTNESEYVALYRALLKRLYSEHPDYAAWRFSEFKRNVDEKNPFRDHGTFQNFIVVRDGGQVAHISAMVSDQLPREAGLLGYFDCINDITVARQVFAVAIRFLKEKEKKIMYGPIQFTTWQSFRLAESGKNAPFFTEPYNLEYYKHFFDDQGFIVAQNSITRVRDVQRDGISVDAVEYQRLLSDGFSFERVSKETAVRAMHDIYTIALASFCDTLLFTPVSFEEFSYQYGEMSEMVDASVVFIARNSAGDAIAFCFAVPNMLDKTRKSLVIKTMGVLPKYQNNGIGKAILYVTESTAKRAGFVKFIYSTMRVDNEKIQLMTSSTQDILRSYVVYQSVI